MTRKMFNINGVGLFPTPKVKFFLSGWWSRKAPSKGELCFSWLFTAGEAHLVATTLDSPAPSFIFFSYYLSAEVLFFLSKLTFLSISSFPFQKGGSTYRSPLPGTVAALWSWGAKWTRPSALRHVPSKKCQHYGTSRGMEHPLAFFSQ